MGSKRLDLFLENHIGIGIRWASWNYALDLSISLLFLTITIGIGKEKTNSVRFNGKPTVSVDTGAH